jgi:hypothetical protein
MRGGHFWILLLFAAPAILPTPALSQQSRCVGSDPRTQNGERGRNWETLTVESDDPLLIVATATSESPVNSSSSTEVTFYDGGCALAVQRQVGLETENLQRVEPGRHVLHVNCRGYETVLTSCRISVRTINYRVLQRERGL